METNLNNIPIPRKNIPQTTIPPGSLEYIVSYLKQGERNKDIPIAMMGVSRLVAKYAVCRNRSYPWHVLLQIRKGELYFRNDSEKPPQVQLFQQGSLLFLPAHSLYTYGSDHELGLVWFHLNPEAAEWHFLNASKIFHGLSEEDDKFRTLIMFLYREYTLAQQPDTNICYHARRLIEHMLVRKLKRFVNETESMRKIRKLFESIELSLDKNWTIQEMARQCGISQSALFTLAQQYYGQSPMARLESLRMTATANLLKNSNLKLDAIAPIVGFSTGFSLSRAFKRFYGLSPRGYMKDNP